MGTDCKKLAMSDLNQPFKLSPAIYTIVLEFSMRGTNMYYCFDKSLLRKKESLLKTLFAG